jgi:hypothetical protein
MHGSGSFDESDEELNPVQEKTMEALVSHMSYFSPKDKYNAPNMAKEYVKIQVIFFHIMLKFYDIINIVSTIRQTVYFHCKQLQFGQCYDISNIGALLLCT